VHTFVKTELLEILKKHRENNEEYFKNFFEETTKTIDHFDIQLESIVKVNDQIIILHILKIILQSVIPYF